MFEVTVYKISRNMCGKANRSFAERKKDDLAEYSYKTSMSLDAYIIGRRNAWKWH